MGRFSQHRALLRFLTGCVVSVYNDRVLDFIVMIRSKKKWNARQARYGRVG